MTQKKEEPKPTPANQPQQQAVADKQKPAQTQFSAAMKSQELELVMLSQTASPATQAETAKTKKPAGE